MMDFSKGAQWSKWDLHIHTPFSIIHHYWNESDTWDKYIQDLSSLSEDFSVIWINDYLFLDWYEKVLEEKNSWKLDNIDLILPVLEFRIEKFAWIEFKETKRINLHVIFSNEVSIETIKSQFLNTLEQSYSLESWEKWTRAITKNSVSELWQEIKSMIPVEELPKYWSDLNEGFNNLNVDEKQIFSSLNKDCFKGKYLIAIWKTEWESLKWTDSSIATKKSIINQANIVFTSSESVENFNKAKEKLTEQQVNNLLLDCSDAHCFSSSKDKDRIWKCFTWIKSNPTFEWLKQILYVPNDRICIQEENPELDKKHWKLEQIVISDSTIDLLPNQTIKLNSWLNSIIWWRGTGKSWLLSLISSFNGEEDNFLKYIKTKWDLKVSISLKNKEWWAESFEWKLSEWYNFSLPIYYLSQDEIEQFSKEDEKENYRRKFLNVIWIENNDYYYNEWKIKAESLISKLRQIDREEESISNSITQISDQKNIMLNVSFSNDDKINSLVDLLKKEKEKYSTGETKIALENISALTTKWNKLNLLIESNLVSKIKQTASSLNEFIKEYNASFQKDEFDTTFKQSIELLWEYDIAVNSDFNSKTEKNKEKVIAYRDSLRKDCAPHIKTLKDNGVKDFQNITDAIEQIDKLLIKLWNHKIRLKDIRDERNWIYVWLIKVLDWYKDSITNAQQDIEEKFKKFTENKDELFNNIFDWVLVSPHTYFNLEVLHRDLAECFYSWKFECISSYTDSFDKNYESFFDNIKKDFLENIANKKQHFQKSNDGYYKLLKIVFQECMNTYITVHPKIQLWGRELGSMSWGQQATLMLKLKLASEWLSKDIIILDQPENHLDNMFIKDNLVKLIKDLKKEKQVIIASHNANLVVWADSEEIIIAQMDDQTSKEYFSWAIENKKIQCLLIDTLEWWEDAFKKRQERYDY